MKKAIVTGATGVVGHALTELLLSEGVETTVIVRENSPRLNTIPRGENIRTVFSGLDRLGELEGQFSSDCDAFFHLGWEGTGGESRQDMYLQNRNVKYALDAVELAAGLGCRVFVGAGSQAEYGRVDGEKLTSRTPVRPENGYGTAKLCAGLMTRVQAQKRGLRHVWVRILSVYGCYDGPQTLVSSCITELLTGRGPRVTQGEQIWDYLYAKDAARALYLAAEYGRDKAVYCLGSGEERPLKEYISMIRDAVDTGLDIRFGELPYPEKQVMYLSADLAELTRDTGFRPAYSFPEGIAETVDWHRRHSPH